MNSFIPKIEKFSDFGPNEPFVARIVMGLAEIVDVTDYDNKDEIKMAINGIFVDGLAPAFCSLQELLKMENGEKEKMLLSVKKEYFSFYDRLWAAYKDQMQKVIKLLGYDLGFVFENDKKFEKGCEEFKNSHSKIPKEFIELIEKNRIAWHVKVAEFRNEYAQHQTLFEKDVYELLSLRAAEICFENCWTLIEFILAHLLCTRLYSFVGVTEIPKEKRDPVMPKKFQILYR